MYFQSRGGTYNSRGIPPLNETLLVILILHSLHPGDPAIQVQMWSDTAEEGPRYTFTIVICTGGLELRMDVCNLHRTRR